MHRISGRETRNPPSRGSTGEPAKNAAMLSYRYVLRLRYGDQEEEVVRHVSYARLKQGQTLSVAGRGKWIVCGLAPSDDQAFSGGAPIANLSLIE
jgi:hypothetical protein